MKKIRKFIHHSSVVVALCLSTISPQLHAAPGIIENSPLFLTNRAEPNVFFMVDDSGSMDIEMMTPESVGGWGGAMRLDPTAGDFGDGTYIYLYGEGCTQTDADNNVSTDCNEDSEVDDPDNHYSWNGTDADNSYVNSFILPTQDYIDSVYPTGTQTNEQRGTWRGRNHDYNQLYYDPGRDYLPWIGENSNGNKYPDYRDKVTFVSPQTVVPVDPYYPDGPKYNLISNHNIPINRPNGSDDEMSLYPAMYWAWHDTDGDGNVDANILEDDHVKIIIQPTGTNTCGNGTDATTSEQVAGAGCMLRSYDDEIRNFANWFVYHRKRDYVAKYAMSYVINGARNVRMGMGTINNQDAAETELTSMNEDPFSGAKQTLLDRMSNMDSPQQGTPLRRALTRAGNYFACDGDVTPFTTSSCAIQKTPAAAPPGACQQNFTVLLSDGARSQFGDNMYGSPNIGNADGDNSSFSGTYYPDGVSTAISDFNFAGEPYADNAQDTLADVAMHFYERDLDTSLDNRVPIDCGVDENPAQHMVTYGVGFGVNGNVDLANLPSHPARGYDTSAGCTAGTGSDFTWFSSTNNANNFTPSEKIDDLVHAAINGRGEYIQATNSQSLSDSLNATLRSIINRTGSASAVALNASSLSTNSVAYFASFNSSTWEGKLSAYPIDTSGNIITTAVWDAHTELENKAATNRAVVTSAHDPVTKTYNPVEFRILTDLSDTQQNDLKTNTNGAIDTSPTADTDAQARLDYLRGDHTCEDSSTVACTATTRFRDRITSDSPPPPATPVRYKLGDIIHSSPVYVGKPSLALPNRDPFGIDGERHSDFKYGAVSASGAFASGETANTRTPMIYVGGNDGMLHAFDAQTGEEIWAYIPSSLFSTGNEKGLHKLTETDYKHNYYVDLDPTVVDAYVDLTGAGADWHTVLVGGLRAGGRGIFAIDVTDPDEIINESTATQRETKLTSRVMWEFSDKDDIDMGLSYSKPQIIPIGDPDMTSPIEWYVVFGNGYNSHNGDTVGGYSTVGSNPFSSKLFILKLSGPGTDGDWDLGTDYWKIDTETPNGTSYTENQRNGMSTPAAADSDDDGIADRVYAGDLTGNLWAFDISGTITSKWDLYKSGGSPVPLLTATDASGNTQPITSKPALGFNTEIDTDTSTNGNVPNLMVYVGTGSYLSQSDLDNTDVQSFYGVWDAGPKQAGHTVDRADSSNSDLVEQTIATDLADDGSTVRVITPPVSVNYSNDFVNTDFGWFMDLPTSGERTVIKPEVLGGIVFFNTLIPSTDACGFGGSGWTMFVDSMSGQAASLSLIDFDLNGQLTAADDTSGGHVAVGTVDNMIVFNATTVRSPGTNSPGLSCPPGTQKYIRIKTLADGSTVSEETCLVGGKLGRTSWRELKL